MLLNNNPKYAGYGQPKPTNQEDEDDNQPNFKRYIAPVADAGVDIYNGISRALNKVGSAAISHLSKQDKYTNFYYMGKRYNAAEFTTGLNHYINAKQALTEGKAYTELAKGQRKAIRREQNIRRTVPHRTAIAMDNGISPEYLYNNEIKYLPNTNLADTPVANLQKRRDRKNNTLDPYEIKREAQPYGIYVPHNQERNPYKDVVKSELYDQAYNRVNTRSVYDKTHSINLADDGNRQAIYDYHKMSTPKNSGAPALPDIFDRHQELIEDLTDPMHTVQMYQGKKSHEGAFLRDKFGFSPMRVRKLKSGEIQRYDDFPPGKTMY